MKAPSTYSRHLLHSRRLVHLGIITFGQHLPPKIWVVAVVVEGVKAVAVEAVGAGVLGDVVAV